MVKYILILSFVLIFCVGIVSAESSFTFQQNEVVNYRFRCLTNGTNTYCSSSTILIINVEYQNGSNALNNVSMSYNATYFNVTLPTDAVGDYSSIILSPTVNGTISEFTYTVTPTGIRPSDQRTESITRTIYVLFGIAIILFIGFLFVKNSVPVKWTFFMVSIIFFVTAFNMITISAKDEVINPTLQTFLDSFLTISYYFYWFVGGLLIIMWSFTFLNTWIFKKNMDNVRRFG